LDTRKHITVLVSNDLEHDQRVAKVCATLQKLNYDITLVGRLLPGSKPFQRNYPTYRFRLLFTSGVWFYAALNIRLFFYLIFKKTDVILANDLDTLLPAFLISKLRSKKLVYDSHEYFTEAEGLTGRSFQKKVWLKIERWIFPKLKYVYTVNESIAAIYRKQYLTDVKVVRNIPLLQELYTVKTREQLDLPPNKKIILLQGAYIDPDRGGMELVQAMPMLDNVLLLIIGSGRDIVNLKHLAETMKLQEKVRFMPRMPFDQLRQYTANADLGLSLDKPLHLNYTYSLPNKLFDYIHAGIPVLVSNLPELSRIVNEYHVGAICKEVTPTAIATAINEALYSPSYPHWKTNAIVARNTLNWQHEENVLKDIYG
jgi:glycosyltransferase involved in cell wall biosynthesis